MGGRRSKEGAVTCRLSGTFGVLVVGRLAGLHSRSSYAILTIDLGFLVSRVHQGTRNHHWRSW